MENSCLNCKYFNDYGFDQPEDGGCRRMPPAPPASMPIGQILVEIAFAMGVKSEAIEHCLPGFEPAWQAEKNRFPIVSSDAWCGEFRRRPKLPAALGEPDPMRREILEAISIAEAEIGVRAANCCKWLDFKNLWDVDSRSDEELLGIPNMGARTVRELRGAISMYLKMAKVAHDQN